MSTRNGRTGEGADTAVPSGKQALPHPRTAHQHQAVETDAPTNSAHGGPQDAPATLPSLPSAAIPRWKRPLDLSVVLLTAPVWAPMALAICAWIVAVSRGGVLYRQERVGHGGKRFVIFKFRTMQKNADTQVHEGYLHTLIEGDAPMKKLDDEDPRLIPGGRLIRAAGLDELPQLLNVLRGEMSIVGPRPCTPAELEKYKRCHRRRFAGLPGLTGSWQVNGKNKTTFSRMIALDVRYLQAPSLGTDLAVILRTAPTLVGQIAESRKNRRQASAGATAPVAAPAPAAAYAPVATAVSASASASPRFAEQVPVLVRKSPAPARRRRRVLLTPTATRPIPITRPLAPPVTAPMAPISHTDRISAAACQVARKLIKQTQRLSELPSHHTQRVTLATCAAARQLIRNTQRIAELHNGNTEPVKLPPS